jgi:GGDEF domain-containing protein
MSSDGALLLPPLLTDGRIDILTGLDAPEIFYGFLKQAIAHSSRNSDELLVLVRMRISEKLSLSKSYDGKSLEFEVAALADFIKGRTRSDENLVRIGEGTFLLLARVMNEQGHGEMLNRFRSALADFRPVLRGEVNSVDEEKMSTEPSLQVEVLSFTYRIGESMLDFLERAGV